MALLPVNGPENSVAEIRKWMKEHGLSQTGKGSGVTPEINVPHRVFHANLQDILDDESLEKAYPTGWRYFHVDENGRLCAVEIRFGADGEEHVLNEVNFGTVVDEQRQLIEDIKDRPELDNKEHALLRLGFLKIKAAWFRGKTRQEDFYCPVSPCFYGLIAGKLYSSAEFLPIVVKVAKETPNPLVNIPTDDLLGG